MLSAQFIFVTGIVIVLPCTHTEASEQQCDRWCSCRTPSTTTATVTIAQPLQSPDLRLFILPLILCSLSLSLFCLCMQVANLKKESAFHWFKDGVEIIPAVAADLASGSCKLPLTLVTAAPKHPLAPTPAPLLSASEA